MEELTMKTARVVTSVILGVVTATWYIIAEQPRWWIAIICIITSMCTFAWANNRVKNIILWVLAMIVCALAIRFAGLPFVEFATTLWAGILAGAMAVVGWAFKAIGLVGGVVMLIIVILVIKAVVS